MECEGLIVRDVVEVIYTKRRALPQPPVRARRNVKRPSCIWTAPLRRHFYPNQLQPSVELAVDLFTHSQNLIFNDYNGPQTPCPESGVCDPSIVAYTYSNDFEPDGGQKYARFIFSYVNDHDAVPVPDQDVSHFHVEQIRYRLPVWSWS
jgi:hypothetical protein